MTDKHVLLINPDGTAEVNGVLCRVVPVEPTRKMIDAPKVFGAITIPENMPDAEAMRRTIERHRKANRDRYITMLSAAAIDLSGLPRLPERETNLHLEAQILRGYQDGWNAALDAMGVKG